MADDLSDSGVEDYIASLEDEQTAADARTLVEMMQRISGHEPALWNVWPCPRWVDTSQERMFTMARARRGFTPEYKDEAVKLVVTTGRAVATVAREVRAMGRDDTAIEQVQNAAIQTRKVNGCGQPFQEQEC